MNTCSNCIRTCSSIPFRFGSSIAVSGAPARSSSKLLPHFTVMSRPVSAEIECADGFGVPSGASSTVW